MSFSIFSVIAGVYDVVKLCKDKSEDYADGWQEDDLLEDGAQRVVSMSVSRSRLTVLIAVQDANLGAVRLA